MNKINEFFTYLSVSVGMALAVSCFAIFSLLFQHAAVGQIVLAIATAGTLCIGVACSISELAGRYPSSSGMRTYLKVAFGDHVSLFVVFMYMFLVLLVAGVDSYVFAGIVDQFVPDFPRWLTIIVLFGTVIGVNLAGLELPGQVQILLTMSLVGGLLAMTVFALNLEPATPAVVEGAVEANWAELPRNVCLAFFLFVGFEWVIQVGRGPSAYQRLIPWAMFASVALLGLTYGLFALALDAHLGDAQITATQTPQIGLGGRLLGGGGRLLFAFLSLLAILTSFNAGLLGATRLMYALSREGHLPKWCARISLQSGAPVGAVLALGAAAIASAGLINAFEAYGIASALSAIIICVTYVSLLAAAWRLKQAEIRNGKLSQERIPAFLQIVIGLVLAGVAAATVFSSPYLMGQFLALASVAGYLTWLSMARARKIEFSRQKLS